MEHDPSRYLNVRGDDRLKWVGVDLDKTMCTGVWPEPGIGPIIEGTKKALDALTAKGWKIIIYTSRPWAEYEAIENWCKDNEIPIRAIICGKPLFKYFIDDRNIEFDGDWDKVVGKIPDYNKNSNG